MVRVVDRTVPLDLRGRRSVLLDHLVGVSFAVGGVGTHLAMRVEAHAQPEVSGGRALDRTGLAIRCIRVGRRGRVGPRPGALRVVTLVVRRLGRFVGFEHRRSCVEYPAVWPSIHPPLDHGESDAMSGWWTRSER